jgi:hypothetical protein
MPLKQLYFTFLKMWGERALRDFAFPPPQPLIKFLLFFVFIKDKDKE